ncbi:MAG: class I SAM-dependent methyltransferase [Rhodospirillaceae bacterium]
MTQDSAALCPLCGATADEAILDRTAVPVFQNVLYATPQEAEAAATGCLAIRACPACGFVHNAAFDPDCALYDANYENNQSHSAVFSRHIDASAAAVLKAVQPGQAVLEVGCGQGYFLTRLAQAAPSGTPLVGFDPAWRGGDPPAPGIEIHARLFDRAAAESLGRPIGAVVTRHVIEHVPDPVAFLGAIRAALPGTHPVDLFIETPCVRWILDNGVVQDFFYEHCSYFTAETLDAALDRSGFETVSVDHVFGGQYLWAHARASGVAGAETAASGDDLRASVATFRSRHAHALTGWHDTLAAARQKGRVALWGGGAKGVTFAAVFDPSHTLIDCIVDINPGKQNRFTPLTAHPVLSPECRSIARNWHPGGDEPPVPR